MHFNPFQNKAIFLCVCRTGLLETLWEKEKLLITNNFSLSCSVFNLLENFPLFLSIFKLSSANSVWKSLKCAVWESVNIWLLCLPLAAIVILCTMKALSYKDTFSSYQSVNEKKIYSNQFNLFPNKSWFLRVCSTSLLKTLGEKEKLLVTSNISFSHSVFYPFR